VVDKHAGNGQSVTHGCLANNATNGATSVSVASGRSVLLKYFSIDGDQQILSLQ
jgi:hypothetical protein